MQFVLWGAANFVSSPIHTSCFIVYGSGYDFHLEGSVIADHSLL